MRTDRKKRSRLPEGDDGRTIVSMNVDGMPWYAPGEDAGRQPERRERKSRGEGGEAFSKREARYATWGALRAALLVTGVMCAGIILFVLFCLHVWFK